MPRKPAAPVAEKKTKQQIMDETYASKPQKPARSAPPPADPVEDDEDDEESYSFNIDSAIGLIPAGTPAIATVSLFEKVTAQSGNEMYKVKLLIDESPYDGAIGRTLFSNLVQVPQAQFKTTQFLNALGLSSKGTHKRRSIEGLQIGVVVGVKPESGEYDASNEPKKFITVEKARERFESYVAPTPEPAA